jgi:predicted enzyme related to lactoylglutathione lyase
MQTTPILRISTLLAGFAILALGAASPVRAGDFPPISSPETHNHSPGKLVWADLFTSKPDDATKFYTGLFGWSSTVVHQKGNSYTIFFNNGAPVAGLSPHSPGKEAHSSKWIGYLSVTDIESASALVAKNGGKVHANPKNFPDRGFQAIVTDGEGIAIGLLQSASGDPVEMDTPTGSWNWFELYSKDPVASTNFFHNVLNFDAAPEEKSGRKSEFVLSSGGTARGGIAPLPEGEGVTASWLGVIRVDDIDHSLAKVTSLGGEVLVPPHAVEFGSRFAIIADPTGGTIGLVQYQDDANPAKTP